MKAARVATSNTTGDLSLKEGKKQRRKKKSRRRVPAANSFGVVIHPRLGWRRRVRMREQLVAAHGRCCAICGRVLAAGERTLDHVIPRKGGGANVLSNLRITCERCNVGRRNDPRGDHFALFELDSSPIKLVDLCGVEVPGARPPNVSRRRSCSSSPRRLQPPPPRDARRQDCETGQGCLFVRVETGKGGARGAGGRGEPNEVPRARSASLGRSHKRRDGKLRRPDPQRESQIKAFAAGRDRAPAAIELDGRGEPVRDLAGQPVGCGNVNEDEDGDDGEGGDGDDNHVDDSVLCVDDAGRDVFCLSD
jgi:5-methylcytosine-specific restriction endonuclease McrA